MAAYLARRDPEVNVERTFKCTASVSQQTKIGLKVTVFEIPHLEFKAHIGVSKCSIWLTEQVQLNWMDRWKTFYSYFNLEQCALFAFSNFLFKFTSYIFFLSFLCSQISYAQNKCSNVAVWQYLYNLPESFNKFLMFASLCNPFKKSTYITAELFYYTIWNSWAASGQRLLLKFKSEICK